MAGYRAYRDARVITVSGTLSASSKKDYGSKKVAAL